MHSPRYNRKAWKAFLCIGLVTLTAAAFCFRDYFMNRAAFLKHGVHAFKICNTSNKYCHRRDNKSNGHNSASLKTEHTSHGNSFSLHVTEADIETFSVGLPQTLPNYRNPCWMEMIPNNFSYLTDNFYYKVYQLFPEKPRHYWGRIFHSMQKRIDWRRRTRTGKHARRIRCFPYFFLVGFSKCGTTDLFQTLKFVPDIIHPITKESQFWHWFRLVPKQNGRYLSRKAQLRDYLDLYDDAAEKTRQYTIINEDGIAYHPGVMGDFDPKTIWYFSKWKLIKGNEKGDQPKYLTQHHLYRLNPKTKFLVLLRHPVDRLFSHCRMFCYVKNNALKAGEIHNIMKTLIDKMKGCMKQRSARYCVYKYIAANATNRGVDVMQKALIGSMYYVFIKDWLHVFPRKQFLFIKSEDYFKSRISVIYEILDFLQLNKTIPKVSMKKIRTLNVINPSSGITFWNCTRRMIWNFLQPFNEKLVNLLQSDKWIWEYNESV